MPKPKQTGSGSQKKTEAPNMAETRFSPTREDRILIAAVAVYVLMRWIATLAGGGAVRAWGLDYASYLPLSWDVAIALSLPLLLLVPQLRTKLARLLHSDAKDEVKVLPRLVTAVITTAGLAVLAWEYQVAFAFLGDGAYYATEVFRINTDAAYQTALIKPTSWLTGHLIRWLTITFPPVIIREPFQIIGVLGMLLTAGGGMLLLLRERWASMLFLVGSMVFSAAVLMFFGYIELYALSFAFTALFFVSSYQSFRHRASVFLPGFFLLVATLLGASAAIFLPAYLLLLHWRIRGEGGKIPLTRAALLLSLLPIAAVILLYAVPGFGSYNPYVLSVLPSQLIEDGIVKGTQYYTLFSPEHLLDVLNVLLLNGGVFALLLPVMLIALRKSIRWNAPAVLFAITAASGGLLLVFAGNSALGLARDWDLMTVPVLGLIAAVGIILLHTQTVRVITLPILVPLIILTSLGGSYAWLRVNLDEPASAARLDHALERDQDLLLPLNTYIGLENLRKFYRTLDNREQQQRVLHRMAATGVQKIDTYTKVMTLIAESKDASERERDYTWLFGRYFEEYSNPASATSIAHIPPRTLRENVSKALFFGLQTGDTALTSEYIGRFRTVIHEWKELPLLEVYQTPGASFADIAVAARRAVDNETDDAALLLAAARLHHQAGEYEDAERYYRRAIDRDAAGFPIQYIELARLLFEDLGRREDGVRVLEDCIRAVPNTREAAKAREILAQLGL